ncbi:MAG TPA: DUF3137 domain-containing protein [Actinomycetes bacterium]|nr:DUF3137 domain-containing protein [Actinomycetes bacterium]
MLRPRSGNGRVLVVGGLLLLASPVMLVGFVAVGITSDDSADVPMILLFLGSLLTGLAGTAAVVAGLVWRASTAKQRAKTHDSVLIARMGRAATAQDAAAVQADGTSRSWMQFSPLIALAVLVVVLFLPFPALLRVAAFALVVSGIVVVYVLPRRRSAQTVAGDWAPPGASGLRADRPTGDPPAAVRERMEDPALTAQARRLWAWHHRTLLAREEAVAALAHRRGWEFRRVDPTLRAGRHLVLNVVRGARDGIPFAAFDDVAATETTVNDNVTMTLQPATSVVIPFAAPFRLAVVPDRIGAGVHWGHIGHQVQLESGAFNDVYNVYCVDPIRARVVLNPAVMARLLDSPGLDLVLENGLLRLDRPGAFAAEPTAEAMVDLAYQVHRSASAAQVRAR